jgi:hypothetical protein
MFVFGQWGNDPLYAETAHTHTHTHKYNIIRVLYIIYLYGSSEIRHYLLRSPIENHIGHHCVCVWRRRPFGWAWILEPIRFFFAIFETRVKVKKIKKKLEYVISYKYQRRYIQDFYIFACLWGNEIDFTRLNE